MLYGDTLSISKYIQQNQKERHYITYHDSTSHVSIYI